MECAKDIKKRTNQCPFCREIIEDLIKTHGESDRMKIDVEGYEKTVILGISKHIGDLSFEWAEESKTDILDSLSHLFSISISF